MSMSRSARARVDVLAPLARPVDYAACGALLAQLVKHTLYTGQQIPAPFDQLAAELQREGGVGEEGRRPRLGGWRRKACKLVEAARPLLEGLPAAVGMLAEGGEGGGGERVVAALLLGSSLSTPRVVYLIRFPLTSTRREKGGEEGGEKGDGQAAVRDNARRLLRALATQAGGLAELDPGPCRAFLLLQAPPHSSLPPSLFTPRPGFTLKLKRAHLARVDV